MLQKVLIANRGEIACRVIKTLRKLGLKSVAVYSEADENLPHVSEADEAYLLGPAPVSESYLNQAKILEISKDCGADGIHPGYGLLSENAEFAAAVEDAGIQFMGPTAEQMLKFGLKHTAREIAETAGVPLLKGTDLLNSRDEAVSAAEKIGYPVMLKSTAGGGGIGMTICQTEAELIETFEAVKRLAQANFGQAGVFLEKYVARARHIEVQIFGDGEGEIIALGDRDCSTQRRNQKVIEESPAPGLTDELRKQLHQCSIELGKKVNYRSAGTIEFLFDSDDQKFYFLEVNTRLQVEHPVTEMCAGVDLVEWMVRLAGGEKDFLFTPESKGASMEVRVYAEDPFENFQPSSGLLTHVSFPENVRVDSWISSGSVVSSFYDPMLAKIIVYGDDRESARLKLEAAVSETVIAGIETNLEYLSQILRSDVFASGEITTKSLASFDYQPPTFSVLSGGMQTTVQDYPGRVNYWNVGIPPSGPMDCQSFKLANSVVGNPREAAGLEITQVGPTIRFNTDATFAISGAKFPAKLDGEAIDLLTPVSAKAGSVLTFGNCSGKGTRAYFAIAGGINVPDYLGSKATFTLGQFGGHGGRALLTGDVLHIGKLETGESMTVAEPPKISNHWDIGVLYGPHGGPDFFTKEDIEMFFSTDWEVHYNSARTGVRLIGPKPEWARSDGGEAGLHPSNLHDNAYAIGAIDFTGDMPVILGPDGPSLGGFVCPAVIVEAERWKMGQLTPGDTVRFINLSAETAARLHKEQKSYIVTGENLPTELPSEPIDLYAQIFPTELDDVVFRRAGDNYLLIEYGEMVLDLELRFKVHVIYNWLLENPADGVLDITPGIRSLQLHFCQDQTCFEDLISHVERAESELTDISSVDIPNRIVHLPLSWDDVSTREAIEKYTKSVYPDAPWCPSNIEFIRRINGLESIEDVYRIVFDASYLVMGLGDVYLGAPVATPLDPRHRLVTTKYNPARTWTPENAVGIGGAYMCVYGMEGPGGYQFVGRTVQMWNKYKHTAEFLPGKPWLLDFFDEVRFYPVSHDELQQHRKDFLEGRFHLKIEESTFNLSRYREFLAKESESIAEFRAVQRKAFQEERQRWEKAGLSVEDLIEAEPPAPVVLELAEGESAIESPITGNVWKVLVEPGQKVGKDETVAILEAMKMELNVPAPSSGTVAAIHTEEGNPVKPGDPLLTFKAD